MKKSSVLTVYMCLLYICLLSTAAAKIKIDDTRTEDKKNAITWTYTFCVPEAKKNQTITINLDLPDSEDLICIEVIPPALKRDDSAAGKWTLKVPKNKTCNIVIKIKGNKKQFTDAPMKVTVQVTDSNGKEIDKKQDLKLGPTIAMNPALLNMVVGGGVGRLLDDSIDFKTSQNAVLIEIDSKWRGIGLAGALFHVNPFLNKLCKPLSYCIDDILFSFTFTGGTSQSTIDGLVFGLSKRVSSQLNFVVGYNLIRGKELSPGFQQSASQLIKKIDLQKYPNYERFKGFKTDGSRAKQKLLDGLPLMEPGKKEKFFPGDPVISSYNHGLYVGFVVPVAFKKEMTK